MSNQWEMPRRGNICSAEAHEFAVSEPIWALLFETKDGYERRDFCLAHAPDDACGEIARWLTRRPEPRAAKVQPFDREATFNFFKRLALQPEGAEISEQKLQFRFVLALLLWRKKVLKLESSDSAGDREVWCFRAPHADETFCVERPELAEDEIESLSQQLETLLADPPVEFVAAAADDDEEPEDE